MHNVLLAVYVVTVEIDKALPLPSPRRFLEKGSLKKYASRKLFLNVKGCVVFLFVCLFCFVLFFVFVKGKLKDYGILKVRTTKPD